MKAKKISSKSADKTSIGKKSVKKQFEPWLKKVNNVDKLFTKKDIKNIVDGVVNRNKA